MDPADHDWEEIGYWYRCRRCGQWRDEQHTPQCRPEAERVTTVTARRCPKCDGYGDRPRCTRCGHEF